MALYNYIKDCVIKSIKIRLSLTNSSASCYLWCHGSVVKMTTTLKMAVTATATSRWFISISWQEGLLNYQRRRRQRTRKQQRAKACSRSNLQVFFFTRTWWMAYRAATHFGGRPNEFVWWRTNGRTPAKCPRNSWRKLVFAFKAYLATFLL